MSVFYKVEAQGDTLYFKGEDLAECKRKCKDFCGDDVPESPLTWTQVSEIPDGEEAL